MISPNSHCLKSQEPTTTYPTRQAYVLDAKIIIDSLFPSCKVSLKNSLPYSLQMAYISSAKRGGQIIASGINKDQWANVYSQIARRKEMYWIIGISVVVIFVALYIEYNPN